MGVFVVPFRVLSRKRFTAEDFAVPSLLIGPKKKVALDWYLLGGEIKFKLYPQNFLGFFSKLSTITLVLLMWEPPPHGGFGHFPGSSLNNTRDSLDSLLQNARHIT